MSTYSARAARTASVWEVHVDAVGAAIRCRTLAEAPHQVAQLIGSYTGAAVTADDVTVTPDLGPLGARVSRARQLVRDAEAAQRAAALESRRIVRELRDYGLSVTDTAAVLGVSRGRVSQLTKEPGPAPQQGSEEPITERD